MHSLHKLLLATTALAPLAALPAGANPLGPNITGGSANITGLGTNSVVITQTAPRTIIDWRSFNISAGEITRFVQPNAGSVVLNRVTGNLGPSTIDGTLLANGRVFLINPYGILIGGGAVINTASFLATTNDIKNADFLAGRYNFTIPGRPDASIVNLGTITASNMGFAALVAPGVRNAGTITANFGRVALASGNTFSLDFYGDRLITLSVSDSVAASVRDLATGQTLTSLVKNEGKLKANGGQVQLSAVTARHVVDSVINNRGVIEARSIGRHQGKIVLGGPVFRTKIAGAPVQTVRVSGTLDVSGQRKGTKAGTIQITGEDIQLSGATLKASGWTGGGTVLIGGDTGGGNPNALVASIPQAKLQAGPVPNATTVSIDASTVINASATNIGDAGKVVVWADGNTNFVGTILAKGGPLAGNAGFVEVSGHQQLTFNGRVDLAAPNGTRGTLLLDPGDYVIDASAASAIQSNLASGNVIIQTTSTGTGGVGDIIVAQSINWTSGSTLTLSAYRNIIVNNGVTISNTTSSFLIFPPRLILRADNTGIGVGTVSFLGTGHLDFSGSIGGIAIYYSPTGGYLNPIDYTSNIILNPIGTFSSYMLVNNVSDLQNIRDNLSGHYALGKNIDASGVNFSPIGTAANPFTGQLVGNFQSGSIGQTLGNTITNLTINSSAPYVGLFGYVNTGIINSVGLINASVRGTANLAAVGTFAGQADSLLLLSSYATGSVAGQTLANVGGLVGVYTGGFISFSFARVSVNVGPSGTAGGLVGSAASLSIVQSYSAGAVTGDSSALQGGLVGSFSGFGGAPASYWDVTASGQSSSAMGTAITTANLKAKPSDLTTWAVSSSINDGYPFLLSNPPPTVVSPAPPCAMCGTPPVSTTPNLTDIFGTGQTSQSIQLKSAGLTQTLLISNEALTKLRDELSSLATSALIAPSQGRDLPQTITFDEENLIKSLFQSPDAWKSAKNWYTLFDVAQKLYQLTPAELTKTLERLGIADTSTIPQLQAKIGVQTATKLLFDWLADKIIDRLITGGLNVPRPVLESLIKTVENAVTLNLKGQLIDQSFLIIHELSALNKDSASLVQLFAQQGLENLKLLQKIVDLRTSQEPSNMARANQLSELVASSLSTTQTIANELSNGSLWPSQIDVANKWSVIAKIVDVKYSQMQGRDKLAEEQIIVAKSLAASLDRNNTLVNVLNFNLPYAPVYQDFAKQIALSYGVARW